jgi:transposase
LVVENKQNPEEETMRKLYGAIDLHSNNNVTVLIDEQDRVVYERRLPNDLPTVLGHLAAYRGDIEGIAVESTYNWYWLVDGLMEAGHHVELVNTAAVKVYDGKKFTGDEHDARHLAHLLRLGILPTGYIYPKAERAVRDLLRKRGQLVRCRTAQILSIENLICRNSGEQWFTEDLGELNEQTLNRLCAGDPYRIRAIQSNLRIKACLDEEVAGVEKIVLGQAKLKPEFKKLLTVPGLGKILGMTVMYETGTIDRFPHVGNFASYARAVDSGRYSNGKKKGSGNAKNGNKYLAWAFVEAVHHAWRSCETIRRFYQRKKAQRNTCVAVKAVAHKIARATYHVLKNQEDFDVTRAFA